MTDKLAKRLLAEARHVKSDVQALIQPPSEITAPLDQPVLPNALFKRCNRGYILKVAYQINRSYTDTCYDACSVMIRRLVETLIIELYEHDKLDSHVKDSNGEFKTLKDMIDITLQLNKWNLTRGCKNGLKNMKSVGDLSAHSRRYNAHREDIDRIIQDLRVTVQELLTLSGMY